MRTIERKALRTLLVKVPKRRGLPEAAARGFHGKRSDSPWMWESTRMTCVHGYYDEIVDIMANKAATRKATNSSS